MNSIARDQLLSGVKDPSSRSVTLAGAERAEVVHATRVTENDWRLRLEGTHSLAGRLEAAIEAAPDSAQGTCRIVGSLDRHHVRMEIGCRGPRLLTILLDTVIDDHAATHPQVRLLAILQVDGAMRPRRIDLLVPSAEEPQGAMLGMLGLVPAQAV